MKKPIIGYSAAALVIFLLAGYQAMHADQGPEPAARRIGVLSVRRIFDRCSRNAVYRTQAGSEQDQVARNLEQLAGQVQARERSLETLKTGSDDYIETVRRIFEGQADLQAQREFQKKRLELKDQVWTERLYADILRIASQTARDMKLEVVLEADRVELPASSPNELMMLIRTHKVLYDGGCLDISDEVIRRLDAEDASSEASRQEP